MEKRVMGPAGPLANRNNNPVVDPTENVKALSEAANKRQDDLREANEKLTAEKISHLERMVELRSVHNRELIVAESQRINEQLVLRAAYDERLGQAEAKRIDAIRAVDVNAVATASARAADQASVLATQVSASADTLRSLVATTASTIAQAQQQIVNQLVERLTKVEQSQYEGKGRSALADPAFAELLTEVKSLRDSRSNVSGKSEGLGGSINAIVIIVGLAIAALSAYAAFRPATPAAPVVISERPVTP